MIVNFSDVQDTTTFSILPAGTYVCRVIDAAEKTNNKDGSSYISITIEVEEGPYTKRLIFDQLFFTEKTIARSKSVLKEFGIQCNGETDISRDMFIGSKVCVTIVIQTYQGVDRNKVTFKGYRLLNADTDDQYVVTEGEPF